MPDHDDPQESKEPKKVGFGSFAKQYRDRWEADHPKGSKPRGDGSAATTPEPVTPATDDDASGGAARP